MTTTLEYILAGCAVFFAGVAAFLYFRVEELTKDLVDTIAELTKTKDELKKEKEAQALEIQTRCFHISEERKIMKFGSWFSLNPQVFKSRTPTDMIEEIIRNDMARKMAEKIKPYIEIGMDYSPDSNGFFEFVGQLSIAAKEPERINFMEAFMMAGVDPEEVK